MDKLMMIFPNAPESLEAVIDDDTRRAAALLRSATDGETFRGEHTCACGARESGPVKWIQGHLSNGLLVHYVAHHREHVPASQLALMRKLAAGLVPVEPTPEELRAPKSTRSELEAARARHGRPPLTNNIYRDYSF